MTATMPTQKLLISIAQPKATGPKFVKLIIYNNTGNLNKNSLKKFITKVILVNPIP